MWESDDADAPFASSGSSMHLSGSLNQDFDLTGLDTLDFQPDDLSLSQTRHADTNTNMEGISELDTDRFVASILNVSGEEKPAQPLPTNPQTTNIPLTEEVLHAQMQELTVSGWPTPAGFEGSHALYYNSQPPLHQMLLPQVGAYPITTTTVAEGILGGPAALAILKEEEEPPQGGEKRKRGIKTEHKNDEQIKQEPRSPVTYFMASQTIRMVPDNELVVTNQPNFNGAPFFLVSYKSRAHKFDLSLPIGLQGKRIQVIVSKKTNSTDNVKKGPKKTKQPATKGGARGKGRGKGKEKDAVDEGINTEKEVSGEEGTLEQLFVGEVGDPGNKRMGSISCVRNSRSLTVHFDSMTASHMQIFHVHFKVQELAIGAPIYTAESIPGLVTSHKTSQHTQALIDLIANRYTPEEVVS